LQLSLSVCCGSFAIAAGTEIELVCSRGLQLAATPTTTAPPAFSSRLLIALPAAQPFTTVSVSLLALAELANQKDAAGRQHVVTIAAPWGDLDAGGATTTTLDVPLHFVPAFYTTFSLLTVMADKFLQLTVNVLCEGVSGFRLSGAELELANAEQCPQLRLAPLSEAVDLVVSRQYEGSYIWRLAILEPEEEGGVTSNAPMMAAAAVKLNFSLDYALDGGEGGEQQQQQRYTAAFQFQDYRTLFTVQARVEPAKGGTEGDCLVLSSCTVTFQFSAS
jgi:hypothetical protein